MVLRRFMPIVAAVCALLLSCLAQDAAHSSSPSSASAHSPDGASQAFAPPQFLGVYCADGVYRDAANLTPLCSPANENKAGQQRIAEEVPPWINLRNPREIVIEDYAPPARAVKPLGKKSRSGTIVQAVVAKAYGLKNVLHAPTHVVSDSRRRLIISDPQLPALQILDGDVSFRIPGGPERRLQRPNGVATDANDNIYVADSIVGSVLVYDPDGHFLRYLGGLGVERPMAAPTALALDAQHGVVYALDSAAGELVMLDLGGKLLKRLGGRRNLGGVSFDFPSEIALRGSSLAVLDGFGTRLQLFDLTGQLQGAIHIGLGRGYARVPEMGLALDAAGNIYMSNGPWYGVRVYAPNGHVLGFFGEKGHRAKAFTSASGISIDSANRLYIADTGNSRVQVYDTAPSAAEDKTAQPASPPRERFHETLSPE